MRKVTLFALVSLLVGPSGEVFAQRRSTPSDAFPPAVETVLRVARSENGLTFVDTGQVFLKHAAAPDVVVLKNGDVLAVFDYAKASDPDEATFLALSRSSDGGQTWSPAKRIHFAGAKGRATAARHGDLLQMPDGRLRLYFTSAIERRRGRKSSRMGRLAVVRAAERRDGFNFRFDPRVKVRIAATGDVHPMSVWTQRQLHLYVADIGGQTSRSASAATRIRHLVSGDGRVFSRLHSAYVRDADFTGTIVPVDDGFRAYASSSAGVISLLSKDGRRWRREEGIRIPTGWDPAVAGLTDGSYVMLYCTEFDATSIASTAIVEAPLNDLYTDDLLADESGEGLAAAEEDRLADTTGGAADDGDVGDSSTEPGVAGSAAGATGSSAGADAGGASTNASLDSAQLADATAEEGELVELGDLMDYWDPISSDGFAPLPDFIHKVDYFEWYSQYAVGRPDDNAYYAYMDLLPKPWNDDAWKQFRSQFDHMFTRDSDSGPPGPWDPSEHPEWGASSMRVQGLLEGFREASLHEGYATPPTLNDGKEAGILDGEEVLFNLRLPPLAAHLALGKATLADAWRIGEDGKVSSDRMLDAWETTLRAANHMEQGATIIEDLVSLAERKLAEENARWALEHDVFSADGLETAFDTLRQHDRIERGFELSMRGEHAFSMDMAQYLFSPPTVDGQPQVNMKKIRAAFDFGDQILSDFARTQPDVASATIDAIDRHSRKMDELMGIGYPDVRAADIRAAWEQERHASPIAEQLIPSLAGYYKIKAQTEASRRATQLAYATHLHKARTGQWPQALDELSPEYGADIRTDPFTGDYFGYRVTDKGPKIYSFSEDGVDSGGVHSDSWGKVSDNDADSDDYVFWPPQPHE